MALSEDEQELVLNSVTNYYVVDDDDAPVSFSHLLPLRLTAHAPAAPAASVLFLHGSADGGLQKVYKPVVAWKLDIDASRGPNLYLLCKDGGAWILLDKPRKSYEEIIRSLLIAAQALHFLKRNPSHLALWPHLSKIFGAYDVSPSLDDLVIELGLVKAFMAKHPSLSKSELLLSLVHGKLGKRKASDQIFEGNQDGKRSKFFVPDEDEDDAARGGLENVDGAVSDEGSLHSDLDIGACDEDDIDEPSDLFDSVCAICDNGGDLLCCEGKCMRSFHATKDPTTDCESLGMSHSEVEAVQNFYCSNCKQNKHQCFSCGKLGSSDPSANPEVFLCANATCGHFYHPKCVARLLFPGGGSEADELEKKIANGETFTCSVHKCLICKQREDKNDEDLQFAICRRCPKAYHRKCLPTNISFDDNDGDQRAWDDLIPKRILIYCRKHKIQKDIKTPIRDHLIFPDMPMKRKSAFPVSPAVRRKMPMKKKFPSDPSTDKTVTKKTGGIERQVTFKGERSVYRDSQVKCKADKDGKRLVKKTNLKYSLSRLEMEDSEDENMGKGHLTKKPILKPNTVDKSFNVEESSSFKSRVIDNDVRTRIKALFDKSCTLTLDDMMKRQKLPSTHNYSRSMDKTITLGKVEGSVEALRTALQKLEEGSSIEDAKAVCEPEIIHQIIKWQNKLKVYLAPFLHGMRYTSYGRHFTKKEKLREIAEKLHWYVQNGDMIVDFCCGANDFSIIMKEKLLETGKSCLFKNFDIIQPKNDFNFEKKDWMKVEPPDLLTGSKLVMGLNPPFGVKASLASKFVKKALEFKPRLLILIVPEETERLAGYDLIWEDSCMFSGKTFYLPGSVDVNDKQMEQWNIKPPHLYLWSRSDWTDKYRAVALQQGHAVATAQPTVEKLKGSPLLEESNDYYNNLSKLCDLPRGFEDDRRISDGANYSSHLYRNSSLPPSQIAEQKKEVERADREEQAAASDFIFPNENYGKPFAMDEGVEQGCKETTTGMVRSLKVDVFAGEDMDISDDSGTANAEVEQTTGSPNLLSVDNSPEDSAFPAQYYRAENLDSASRFFADRDIPPRWAQQDFNLRGSLHTEFGTHPESYNHGGFTDLNEQRREEMIRQQLRMYGRRGPEDFVRNRQLLPNHDPLWRPQFGMPISEPEPFLRRPPAQTFPPELDERSYVGAPFDYMHDARSARPRGPLNFAPAPRRPPTFDQGSSGWLND